MSPSQGADDIGADEVLIIFSEQGKFIKFIKFNISSFALEANDRHLVRQLYSPDASAIIMNYLIAPHLNY